jgi:hypothetical protein
MPDSCRKADVLLRVGDAEPSNLLQRPQHRIADVGGIANRGCPIASIASSFAVAVSLSPLITAPA